MRIRRFTVVLERLPQAFDGLRVAHVSDVHIGRPCPTKSLLRALRRIEVDLLAMTGDLVHHADHAAAGTAFVEAMGSVISEKTSIYAVLGNHDAGLEDTAIRPTGRMTWLDNRLIRLEREGQTLQLAGLAQVGWDDTDLPATFGDWRADATTIVLAHFPATAALLDGAVDLVLSGHSHAGQVRCPGLPFFTNDFLPCRYARGLCRLRRTQLVVSAGCGYSGPMNLRLFAEPEIGVITLRCGGSQGRFVA